MSDRVCAHCGEPMPVGARSQAKYCSPAHRVRAAQLRKEAKEASEEPVIEPVPQPVIEPTPTPVVDPVPQPVTPDFPPALTRVPRWVRRSASKMPLTVDGAPAKSNQPDTWSPFSRAVESTAGVGLGFVLAGDGLVCVDFDHCFSGDSLAAEVEEQLSRIPPTYMEVSPSGEGLHVWGKGLVLTSRKIRRPGISGEVAGSRKYISMTGRRFRGAPLRLADISGMAGALIF